MEKNIKPLMFSSEADIDSSLVSVKKLDLRSRMIGDLFKILNPEVQESTPGYSELKKVFTDQYLVKNEGCWVYFPWKATMLGILKEEDFFLIKTARNKYLINQEEQDIFRNSSVSIAGLSIGNGVAATLVLTGGPKKLTITDPDEFDLSNLNRVRVSLFDLGKPKPEVLAQQLYEMDPFLDIKVILEGVDQTNITHFLEDPDPAVVVDEMDNLQMKSLLRLEARRRKLPVVMATDNDDGVLLDIERFDLDPTLPIFHGLVDEKILEKASNLTKDEKVKISSQIVGKEFISPRMLKSLMDVGKKLPTWPQLGTAATMSSAVVAYAVRKIILKEKLESQRVLITPRDLVT